MEENYKSQITLSPGDIFEEKETDLLSEKLKAIDKFAKELGVTLYNIKCSINKNGEEFLINTPIFNNHLPEKWADKTYYLNEEQKEQVEKIELKIRKMNDDIYDKVKKMFNDIGVSMGVFHDFSYSSLMSTKN